MPEALVIDSTAEEPTNVQVDLFAYPFAVTAMRFPTPPLQPRWAVPDDADGDVLVDTRYGNREITISLEIVPTEETAAARAVTAEAALASLADKVTKINREDGTLRRMMPSGKVQTFDLLTADSLDPPWDIEWDVGQILRLELKFTAKSFWRGVEISGTTDSFAANTIADYTVTGTGAAISGGSLIVSSTSAKTWLHTARRFIDGTVTLKFTTGASVTTWTQQIIGKAADASNHLCVQMTQAGAIAIIKTVRGSPTTLASTAGANLSTATGYWLRLVMCSNVLTGELWTTDPTLGGSPARTVTWTLAAGDITTYGEGVSGLAGFGMTPGGSDWTYDDYAALWRVQEKTLPLVTLTTPGAIGDAPALGRLVITDLQGVDQGWFVWGLQSQTYSSAATAALFYEAESRTPMGTATVGTLAGASGGGSNNVVTEGSLTPRWGAVLSTQASGGGAHLTHTGAYRVFGRIYRPATNAGAVSVALEWAVGDFRSAQRNAARVFAVGELDGVLGIADFGTVYVEPGTTRWEGRIIANSTVSGDALSIDCIWLVPIEGSGEASAITAAPTAATAFVVRDEFNQAAGALNGKTAPVGGAWATTGAATDYTVDATTHTLTRNTANDAGNRYATAGAGIAGVAAAVDLGIYSGPNDVWQGMVLRWTNTTNFLSVQRLASSGSILVQTMVAGRSTTLATLTSSPSFGGDPPRTLQVTVSSNGAWSAWLDDLPAGSGFDAVLASGGALASGGVGILDSRANPSGTTVRYYDNFASWALVADAAVFASQSAEIGQSAVQREDSTGNFWTPISRYAGDRLWLPVAGPEGSAMRAVVKASRATLGEAADSGVDDVAAQLFITPQSVD